MFVICTNESTIDTVSERFRQMYAKDPATFYNAYPNLFNYMIHPIDGQLVATRNRFLTAINDTDFAKQFTFIIEQ